VVLAGLVTAAGCRSTSPCNGGTVLVTVTFDATTSAADVLDVAVSVDGGAPKTTSLPHTAGDPKGSVEIDFPNGTGYPEGKRLDVTVVARAAGSVVGTATANVATLPSGCGTVAVTFGAPGTDGGAGKGGQAGTGAGGKAGKGGGGNGATGGSAGSGGSVDGGADGPTTGCTSGSTRSCAADGYLGNCAAGTETCAAGKWSACTISPAAKDSCATKGDDATCNGTPNEGCACLDVDPARLCSAGGALGSCAKGMQTCSGGKWGTCSIAPAAQDDCTIKGDDSNCNGSPNDGCPCVNGDTQACGPAAIGICKPGTATCTGGVWGACVGAVNKAPRDCTSAADNDCDGLPDNTIDVVCKCGNATSQACGAHPGNDGYGPCTSGKQSCVIAADKASSTWGACSGAVGPAAADTCVKGNDDNCNGTANEGCACLSTDLRSCASAGALGNCAKGTQTCSTAGQWGACSVQPASADSCSVKGDDATCNGKANEGCPCVTADTQSCGPAAVGICKPGTATCTNGVWGACVGAVNKGTRDCTSTADNDCDGSPDNTIDLVCTCTSGKTQACGAHPGKDGNGPCKAGTQTCVVAADKASSTWGACGGSVGPAASDTCVAGNDNNCSGTANDGCLCVNNVSTRKCGYCNDGSQTCVDGTIGSYTTCVGATGQPFTPLTLENSWTGAAFGTASVAAALDCSGIVQLKGGMSTSGTNTQAFTLPAALRPAASLWIPVDGYASAKVRIYVPTTGAVNVYAQGATTDATQFTSLEGVSFPVSSTGYTPLTLQNGWTPYSGARAPAVANVGGIIRFQGAISGGTTTSVFTLPAGMWPPTITYVTVDLVSAAKGRLIINTNGTVTVQAQNLFSDAQGFTSLEGAWFALSSSGYTPLTLQNGWTTYSSTRAAAVSVSNGIVRFQGAIGTSGTNLQPFTMPGGFLPAASVYTPIDLCSANKGRLEIEPDGSVYVEPEGGTTTNATCFTSLEGVSFAQ
jgi:hypothetical protein